MTILLSNPFGIDNVGPSRPFTHIWNALQALDQDADILVPGDLPAYDGVDRWNEARSAVWDDLATHHERVSSRVDVFIGPGGDSWQQMKTVQDEGGIAITTWFSTYHEHRAKVLREEYDRYGQQATPFHPYEQYRWERDLKYSDAILVPSQQAYDTYPEWAQDKAYIVNFGVDQDTFHPPEDRAWMPDGKLRIFCPMTNPYRKGLKDILDAWRMLDYTKYELTITGGWNDKHALPGSFNINTPGWVDRERIPELYREHDVTLLPSLEEGQALATLESLATGTPIIATPQCGLEFTDGQEGEKIAPRDPQDIVDKLEYLREDPGALPQKSKNAQAFVENDRSWEDFQQRVQHAVQDIMEEHNDE